MYEHRLVGSKHLCAVDAGGSLEAVALNRDSEVTVKEVIMEWMDWASWGTVDGEEVALAPFYTQCVVCKKMTPWHFILWGGGICSGECSTKLEEMMIRDMKLAEKK